MQKILLSFFTTLCFLCFSVDAQGQQNKWFKKARKAQVTLVTYDADGQMLRSTNAFFVGRDGVLLTDYASLRGAARIVALDEKGHEFAATKVIGANALYDVASLRVPDTKIEGLTLASAPAAAGETVFMMPYLSNKSGVANEIQVEEVAPFGGKYAYYTLPTKVSEKCLSCPLMNAQGEVLGLVQLSAKANDSKSYAIAADYAMNQRVTALSATASDYRELLLRKELPADASQAASFIYLIGTRDTALYLSYVDDFIERFPSERNGYTMKAEMLAAQNRFNEADEAWTAASKNCPAGADEIHYSRARTLFAAAQKSDVALPPTWTLEQALAEADAAIAVQSQPVYTALQGHILYAMQRYADACMCFQEVTHTNMRSAEYFLYAAQCKQMLADTLSVLALQDSAVACYTKPYVAEAAPALLMRSQTLLSLNRYREAVMDLMEYEHLKPTEVNAHFYYMREQAEMHCRMFQQALSDIERAVRMEPQEPLYLAELASVHFRFRQMDEAVTAARQAIALAPSFADAYRILGICLREQGKKAEAQAALQKAVELGDEMAKGLLEK